MIRPGCLLFAIALCMGLAMLGGIAVEPMPKAEPKVAVKWTDLFDGKTLTGWKSPNFGTQGETEVKDGTIILNFGDGITGITWDKEFPSTGYEVELEAMRVEGNDFFCGLTFPVDKKHLSFIVGGWGGTVVGISNLDGQDAANNDTAQFKEFKSKQWYKIRVRVINERLMTWIDDKEICDVDLRTRELSVRPEVDLSKPLGVSAWKTTAALKNLRYRLLSVEEKQALLPKAEK